MKTVQLQKILKEPSVDFNEAKHIYPHKLNGELYTGCTTISDAWKKDFLAPWAAKEAVKDLGYFDPKYDFPGLSKEEKQKEIETAYGKLLSVREQLVTMTPEEYLKRLEWAKGASVRKGNQAKEAGTISHNWIANRIDSKIDPNTVLIPTPGNKEAFNACTAFAGWAKNHEIMWLASEEVVCADEFKIAGKLDAIAVIDGITYLVDFKTSSQLSSSYLLQCAGYDIMLREMGFQVMGYMIIRIPKDGSEAETITMTDQEDMKFFRETFLKQRDAHKFYVYTESKFKDASTKRMRVDDVVKASVPGETVGAAAVAGEKEVGKKKVVVRRKK